MSSKKAATQADKIKNIETRLKSAERQLLAYLIAMVIVSVIKILDIFL